MICNPQFQRGQAEVYFRVFLSSLPTFGKHRSSVSFHTYVINASFVKFPFFINGMCGSLYFIASYPTVFFTRLLFLYLFPFPLTDVKPEASRGEVFFPQSRSQAASRARIQTQTHPTPT